MWNMHAVRTAHVMHYPLDSVIALSHPHVKYFVGVEDTFGGAIFEGLDKNVVAVVIV